MKGRLMKNIFYFYYINKIGGIETFFYQLAKKYKDWDITIYYRNGDVDQINRIKQYVRCTKYKDGMKIKCDKAFFNFNIDIIDNVEAKEYGLILHGDYKDMIKRGQLSAPPTHPKINKYYGVSQLVCDSFEELTGIKPILVYNPIQINKPKKILNIISATRLTREKGKDRIIKLAKMLDNAEIPYLWTIFTDDTNAINNPNIIYMKPKLDITGYIANADYLVQLSDNEGYCYSVVEALTLGTPVIVTDMPVMTEIGVVNGENGYIVDFNLSNIDILKIYNKKLNFKYQPKKDTWGEILEKGKSTYQDELKATYIVEALDTYTKYSSVDIELGRIPKEKERWEVGKARLDLLLGGNELNRVYVKLIGVKK